MADRPTVPILYLALATGTTITFKTTLGNRVEVQLLEGMSDVIQGARQVRVLEAPGTFRHENTCMVADARTITVGSHILLVDVEPSGHCSTSEFDVAAVERS